VNEIARNYRFDIPSDASADTLNYVTEQLTRSFKLSRLEIAEEGNVLKMTMLDDVDETTIRKCITSYFTIGENIQKNLLYQYESEILYSDNPQTYLEATNQVINHGRGLFSFQGEFAQLMQALDNYLLAAAKSFNAHEQEHPSVWPIELYKSIDYFSEYPHHAMLMTSVKESYDIRMQFAKKYGRGKTFEDIAIDDSELVGIRFAAPNACCDCCYYSLQGRQLDENVVYTTRNKAVRNEHSGRSELDRLRSFTMRELVSVGTEIHVKDMRQKIIDRVIDVLGSFGLSARLETAHDPFFGNESAMKNVFQYMSNVKLEILARLNFNNSFIAVGSINWHLDFFGKAFDIHDLEGNTAHSGCFGVGFERFVYALYCQFGTDTSKWPSTVRSALCL